MNENFIIKARKKLQQFFQEKAEQLSTDSALWGIKICPTCKASVPRTYAKCWSCMEKLKIDSDTKMYIKMMEELEAPKK